MMFHVTWTLCGFNVATSTKRYNVIGVVIMVRYDGLPCFAGTPGNVLAAAVLRAARFCLAIARGSVTFATPTVLVMVANSVAVA